MVKRLLTDVLKRLCGADDLEYWHALNTLHASIDGNFLKFEDVIPLEDWEQLRNPVQFERIWVRAWDLKIPLASLCVNSTCEGCDSGV
jgi:hypothetical protein